MSGGRANKEEARKSARSRDRIKKQNGGRSFLRPPPYLTSMVISPSGALRLRDNRAGIRVCKLPCRGPNSADADIRPGYLRLVVGDFPRPSGRLQYRREILPVPLPEVLLVVQPTAPGHTREAVVPATHVRPER